MSEEKPEETTEVHVSDEDFVNTLSKVRSKQTSEKEEELQALALRLQTLQQKLAEIKVVVRREKAANEADLLSKIVSSAMHMQSVDDLNVRAKSGTLLTRIIKLYDELLDREFPSEDTQS